MPTNYVLKRLIGYAFTDDASDLLKSYQFMNYFRYDIPRDQTDVVSSGAWSAAEDCSASIPTGVRMGIFGIMANDNIATATVSIRPNGSTWAGGTIPANAAYVHAAGVGETTVSGQRSCMLDSAQQIQYYNNAGTASTAITVEGFVCGLF